MKYRPKSCPGPFKLRTLVLADSEAYPSRDDIPLGSLRLTLQWPVPLCRWQCAASAAWLGACVSRLQHRGLQYMRVC
jgi:hypothetical protein